MRPETGALLLIGLAGCSSVRESHVRPDYEAVDRTRTVRLTVVVAPLPEAHQDLGDMWSMMARRYVNQHRDFLVTKDLAAGAVPSDACAGDTEGVLAIAPAVHRSDTAVAATAAARLVRCRDGEEVWAATAAGTWPVDDADLIEARRYWVEQTAPVVDPYVVATFRLLTDLLATLPHPAFPDERYVREKIDLGE